jgi:hypothetical protein
MTGGIRVACAEGVRYTGPNTHAQRSTLCSEDDVSGALLRRDNQWSCARVGSTVQGCLHVWKR